MQQQAYINDFVTAEDLLKKGGFSEQQAKSIVTAIHNSTTLNLATKEQLNQGRTVN